MPPDDPNLALPPGALNGPDGQPFEVPPGGALGLLAVGWIGLRLWREARESGGWQPSVAPPPADTGNPHHDVDA
ncbi:MAG: hypothetical protein PVF91_14155 [Chromatiales bacterium]|jgi:hypothetical protein